MWEGGAAELGSGGVAGREKWGTWRIFFWMGGGGRGGRPTPRAKNSESFIILSPSSAQFNDKDPNSEFVQGRRVTLSVYLNQLLEVNQNLAYDPIFMEFFDMEEISMQVK